MAFEFIRYLTDGGTACACLRADRGTRWFGSQGLADEPYQTTAKIQGRDKQ